MKLHQMVHRSPTTVLLVLAMAGCGDGGGSRTFGAPDDDGARPQGSAGVTQGGAQDIAFLRSIVAEGGVPSSTTLDPVGFFAEHAVDLPSADCGETICFHPLLAVAPRFDGGNWTTAFVGLNTLARGADDETPLHVVVALERSTLVSEALNESEGNGVRALAQGLADHDLVSVMAVGQRAEIVIDRRPAPELVTDPFAILDAIAATPRDRGVDLFGGLRAAAGHATQGVGGPDRGRVVLVTSGVPTAGITNPERILSLGESLARTGLGLSVVGVSTDGGMALAAALGDVGAGTYAHAEDGGDFTLLMRREGRTRLTPLGYDLRLAISPRRGYEAGELTGARRAQMTADGHALIESPVLMLGGRVGADDVAGGRRGGGGGLFVRLDATDAEGMAGGEPAFDMTASYVDARSGETVTSTATVLNALPPGQNPEDIWPWFSNPEHGKPFMMLNMYFALRTMLELFEEGDCARARGTVEMMEWPVEEWLRVFPDPDIEADWALLLDVDENIETQCEATPIEPTEIRNLSCFSS